MAQIDAAVAFVRNHGTPAELARLNVMLGNQDGVLDGVRELTRMQRPDSGWAPFWTSNASSVDATCYRLAYCEQLGLSHWQCLQY